MPSAPREKPRAWLTWALGLQDKEKVAEYKANIKAQLTRAGLIRGQPRAIYNSVNTSSPAALPSYSASATASDRYAPSAVAGPGPTTSTLRRGRPTDYTLYQHPQRYDTPASLSRPSTMMSGLPGLGTYKRPRAATVR